MKSIDDALELRGRIFGAFEMAELGASKGEPIDDLLTFVVVGAGPTGVEMAGQIAGWRTARCGATSGSSTPARLASSSSTPPRRCCRRSARSSAPRPRPSWRRWASRCCWAPW